VDARRSTSLCSNGSTPCGGIAAAARGTQCARSRPGHRVALAGLTQANRLTYLGTIAPGEDIADPEVSRAVAKLRGRAVAVLASFHCDIAQDSARLRYALECWTGLNRAATRRWLRGETTRQATQELLASTLEHALRTFGAPPRAH